MFRAEEVVIKIEQYLVSLYDCLEIVGIIYLSTPFVDA